MIIPTKKDYQLATEICHHIEHSPKSYTEDAGEVAQMIADYMLEEQTRIIEKLKK